MFPLLLSFFLLLSTPKGPFTLQSFGFLSVDEAANVSYSVHPSPSIPRVDGHTPPFWSLTPARNVPAPQHNAPVL